VIKYFYINKNKLYFRKGIGMKNTSKSSTNYYNIALNLFHNNNLSSSINNLKESLKNKSNNIEALNLLGLCYFKMCDFKSAKLYWKKSLKINNEDNNAKDYLKRLNGKNFLDMKKYYTLALKKVEENNYVEAITLFLEIIRKNKDLVEPYIMVGLCNYKLNNYSQAIYYWEEAKDRDKGNNKIKTYMNDAQNRMIVINKKTSKNKKNIYVIGLAIFSIFIVLVL